MFENQTKEEEEEEDVIFQRDNREYWCALRNQKPLVIDQFQLQEPKTISSCLDVCFTMVQVMLSLWSLFIEFLGSYSRCRVTNGVIPHVHKLLLENMGEHSNHQNVVVFPGWTSECCCVLHQNVDVHDVLHLGSSMMNVWWVSGLVPGVTWDLLSFIHQKVTSPYASKVAG